MFTQHARTHVEIILDVSEAEMVYFLVEFLPKYCS